jgi:putative membrane protein
MAALVLLQAHGWYPMGGWGWGMMIISLIFWIIILAIVAWLFYRLFSGARGVGRRPDEGRAEEILRERFARGEIDSATFERMLEDLRRTRQG